MFTLSGEGWTGWVSSGNTLSPLETHLTHSAPPLHFPTQTPPFPLETHPPHSGQNGAGMTKEHREALIRYAIVEYQGAIDHAVAVQSTRIATSVEATLGRLRREQRLATWKLLVHQGDPTRGAHISGERLRQIVSESRTWLTEHPEHIDRIEGREVINQ